MGPCVASKLSDSVSLEERTPSHTPPPPPPPPPPSPPPPPPPPSPSPPPSSSKGSQCAISQIRDVEEDEELPSRFLIALSTLTTRTRRQVEIEETRVILAAVVRSC
uniref:Uncharacterized protein n=1 Tax=Vespula pensylvanica TaxID=30213 RepID=A0A834UCV2_VESPE|nr:hypothetical protein H0235_004402 [Vespula pensylvanica]